MNRRVAVRALRPFSLRRLPQRFQSTASPSDPGSASKLQSRIDRVIARFPRSLQPYANPLRTAPLTHLTSFLILHELTAIVPLLSLFAIIHYSNWLPPWFSNGVWVTEGVQKFGRYFRRKGWFVDEAHERSPAQLAGTDARIEAEKASTGADNGEGQVHAVQEGDFGLSDRGVKILVEVATAWAVTKALLPIRLIVSVWATPWFARVCLSPGLHLFRRLSGRAGTASAAIPGSAGKASLKTKFAG